VPNVNGTIPYPLRVVNWRNIAITLTTGVLSVNAWFRQLSNRRSGQGGKLGVVE